MTAALDAAGPWAPVVYVVGFTAVVMVGVPRSALTLAGGVAFGPVLGIALAWAASLIAAIFALLVGRALGEDLVERRAGPRLRRVRAALHSHSTKGVLLTRMTPVPFAVVNYSLGALGVRTRPYVIGTAIGMVPGAIVFAGVGSSVATGHLEWTLAGVAVISLAWLGARGRAEGEQRHTAA
jgi:uncharacterized membrane protein YdjX (TVP38/TMEM64 family)